MQTYLQFIARFPDIATLARAPLHEILRVWQGLGYNRRALALKQIAGMVLEQHGGKTPCSPDAPVKLPGILTAAMSNTPTPICEPERTETRASLMRGIKNLCGVTARKSSISLIDQVVVSGVNFITTVFLGRLCGPEELAKYSLGFTLIIIIVSVQETLITTPYTIYAHRLEKTSILEYRGAVLVQWVLLSALAMLTLAVWATVTLSGLGLPGLAPVLFVLSLVHSFLSAAKFRKAARLCPLGFKCGIADRPLCCSIGVRA